MPSARPSSARISSVCSPSDGDARSSSAGVPAKRIGWRGSRNRPTTSWSFDEQADGAGVLVVDELGGARGPRARHPLRFSRSIASAVRERRRVRVALVHHRLHQVAVLDPLGRSSRPAGRRRPRWRRRGRCRRSRRRTSGVAMPNPSWNRNGRKAETKLEFCVPSRRSAPRCRRRPPTGTTHRVEHRQLDVLATVAARSRRAARR